MIQGPLVRICGRQRRQDLQRDVVVGECQHVRYYPYGRSPRYSFHCWICGKLEQEEIEWQRNREKKEETQS